MITIKKAGKKKENLENKGYILMKSGHNSLTYSKEQAT